MTKPTAEEALEWLGAHVGIVSLCLEGGVWFMADFYGPTDKSGATPLEAIRNAMKGEGDD